MAFKISMIATKHVLLFTAVTAPWLALSVGAMAQEAAPQPSTDLVDITAFTEPLLETFGVVLAAVLSWGMKRLADRFKLSIDVDKLQIADFVANKAVHYARQKITDTDGKVTAHIKNDVIETAARYLAEKAPETLNHFGVNPATEEGKAKIRELIEARLPLESEPDVRTGVQSAPAG
jgi:hypothetical protein